MISEQKIIFDSRPNPERHPDRLRIIASLRGLDTVKVSNSKILDLGCGVGMDAIHFGSQYPSAEVLGIDISTEHLEIGRKLINYMKLTNVKLREESLITFNSKEKYDYITCHGLFSWTDDNTRKNILRICKDNLSSNGLACISFNCLPGWQYRQSVVALLKQTDDKSLPAFERVINAKDSMKAVIERLEESQNPSSQSLKAELQSCIAQSAAFIFHELLAENTEGIFLNDFLKQANFYGLQYLGDGRPSRMRLLEGDLPDINLRKELGLDEMPTDKTEQIWDIILPTPIRSCILCHDSQLLYSKPEFSKVFDTYISSTLVPLAEEPRVEDSSIEIFCDAREYNLEISDPQLKGALSILAKSWPKPKSFKDLLSAIGSQFPRIGPIDTSTLLTQLGEYFFMNLIDLYCESTQTQPNISKTPELLAFARQQVQLGLSWVSNTRFEFVNIDELDRVIMPLLNGKNTVKDCLEYLLKIIEAEVIDLAYADDVDPNLSKEDVLMEQLKRTLEFYRESALLVS